MKIKLFYFLIVLITFQNTFGQSKGAYENETKDVKAQRMQWYTDARFGMFIHWGAYSVLDGEYKGEKQTGALGEHIMHNLEISIDDYKKDVVGNFNPTLFNADTWVKAAYDAGMKYVVMTTKHHDGFALFKSDVSDYNIVAQTPFKRDAIKEISEACAKYGLKFGVYYSQAQDWYHPGGYTPSKQWDKKQEGDWDAYFETIVKGQVTELFTNYGEISLIWWDSARRVENPDLANKIGKELVKLQPNIIVNPRLSKTSQKDFQTFEQNIPGILYEDYNELCLTQNRSWSYKPSDKHWKSPEFLLKTLVHMASMGGNFLFNIGPKPNGEFPHQATEALTYIGEWMDVNNEAIYSTKASPFYKLDFGEATYKTEGSKTALYLFVYKWPKDGILKINGFKNQGVHATILGQDSSIKATNKDDHLILSGLPTKAPHEAVSVIKIEVNKPLNIEVGYVKTSTDYKIKLTPLNALLSIKPQFDCIPTIEYHNGEAFLNNWKNCIPSPHLNTGNALHWKIEVQEAGNYKVILKYATKVEGNIITLKGRPQIKKALPNSGGLSSYKLLDLGELSLEKGLNTLTFTGGTKNDLWDEVRFKSLELVKN